MDPTDFSGRTKIAAYDDRIMTVAEVIMPNGMRGIKYWISYDGGQGWYYGYVASPPDGVNYFDPDVAGRLGGVGESDRHHVDRRVDDGAVRRVRRLEVGVRRGSTRRRDRHERHEERQHAPSQRALRHPAGLGRRTARHGRRGYRS